MQVLRKLLPSLLVLVFGKLHLISCIPFSYFLWAQHCRLAVVCLENRWCQGIYRNRNLSLVPVFTAA